MPGNSNSGGANKKSIAQLKAEGTFRADRHGSFVDASHNQLQRPTVSIDRDEIFRQWAERIHAAGLGQEQDAVIAEQLTNLTIAYNHARKLFDEDPESKSGSKMSVYVMMDVAKEIRMIMAEYRMMPSTRNPTMDDEKDDLGKFLDGVV